MVNEMSRDHLGSDQGTTKTDDHSVHLPVYLAYLSLGFKVISTVIIVLMAGWVIVTIRTRRNLHNIHNIFVDHALMLCAFSTQLPGASTGVGDFIGCNVFVSMLYSLLEYYAKIFVLLLVFLLI